MSSAALQVGTKVGHYEVRQVIGRGGMGTVYEGLHPLIHKRVAIKVLHRHLSQDEEMTGRFLAEARAVNAIGHRGIIDIFGFDQLPRGEHYFVMELLEGRSLDQVLTQVRQCSVTEVLVWGVEILDALSAAHDAGVVHRDLKPSNLFLVEPSRGAPYMKVLDFGIAKMLSHGPQSPVHTRVGLVGTPTYVSPEQVTGAEITYATDLYSLGCVFFELLTGSPPFQFESSLGVMRMHVQDVPPLVSERAPGIPPELDRLVAQMLRKKPEDRPASADAVLAALTEIAQAQRTASLPPARVNVETGPGSHQQAGQRHAAEASLAPLTATRPSRSPLEETRAAPITLADSPSAVARADPEVTAPSSPSPLQVTSRQRAPVRVFTRTGLLLGAGAGVVLVVVALVLAMPWLRERQPEAPRTIAAKVVEAPSPGLSPVIRPGGTDALLADQAEDVVAEADSGTALPEVKAHARPVKAQVTNATLAARLTAFERRLAAHEMDLGDRDALLRGQLSRARDEVRAAKSPRELAAAERLVTSLERQLR